MVSKLLLDKLVERRLKLFAPDRKVGFFPVSQSSDAGRFLNDEQMLIDIHQPDVSGRRGRCRGVAKNLHDIAGLYFSLRVEAEVPVDLNAAAGDELPSLVPGLSREQSLERGG